MKFLIRHKTILGFFLTLIFLPATASSEEIYKFERMWPTLQQPWYFNAPQAIAINGNGTVYIADTDNHRVLVFSSGGHLITKWGAEGDAEGQFYRPGGIAIDDRGDVYVTDYGNARVQKFTPHGQFLMNWGNHGSGDGEFMAPIGIAINPAGMIYVVDSYNHRIQVFDSDFNFVAKWGEQGAGDGQFQYPEGIAIDANGNVYIADKGVWDQPETNHRIQKFTSGGEFITTWGSPGTGNGELNFPKRVAVLENQNVCVADTDNDRIQVFTPDGDFLFTWGSHGFDDGGFMGPSALAIDKRGLLFLGELFAHRIQLFDISGNLVTKWASYGNGEGMFNVPSAIDIDAGGKVFIADINNSRIQVFTSSGQYITQWGEWGDGESQFAGPSGIAIDAPGNVYVAEEWSARVQKFTSDGNFISQWGAEGTGDGQFNNPTDIAVDSVGNIYVVDSLNFRIQKFTSDGVFITKWGKNGANNGEFGGSTRGPSGIAIDSQNNVYVADLVNHRVQKFTSDGVYIAQWGEEGSNNGQLKWPEGIDIDDDGNVYVADKGNNRLQKFTSSGIYLTQFGQRGSEPRQFSDPIDIAVGPEGKVNVVDSSNNRIQVFKKVLLESNYKAIIVAGGGPYSGNNLWSATQLCANFAYRTLTYQGFDKKSIHYLTSNTTLDLDSNGELDDVDGDATNNNLNHAITTWANDADNLVLYLVDHGGRETFRMRDTETLSAADLDSWLDQLQSIIPGKVIIIYDGCESGSFLSSMLPPHGKQRIVITSTAPGENAYFVAQGSISFSNYFWTHIFNGLNIKEAFELAKTAIQFTTDLQNPFLDADGNGTANEPMDYSLTQGVFIGNGTIIHGDAPIIGGVSRDRTISETASADLSAYSVTDNDGIARVWAVIRPPDLILGSSSNPVQELPSIDLMPVGGDQYKGTYIHFNIAGTYQIAIYARDRVGNTSIPQLTTVNVENPLRRKAVLVAGGSQSDALWPSLEKTLKLTYEALSFQGYSDADIYLMSPASIPGVTKLPVLPTLSNLEYAVTVWARQSTQDAVVYMAGSGGYGIFEICESEILSADTLDSWLDDLQDGITGKVAVVYDANRSGSFFPAITPPEGKERILISGSSGNQAANFISNGDISFSKFFWKSVLNGKNVRDAFRHAQRAMKYCNGQIANLDDNGNGVGNEKTDGVLAKNYTIGAGIILAGDDPVIGTICANQLLQGSPSAAIWVEDVTTTGSIEKVWAVISPPVANENTPGRSTEELVVVELINNGSGHYEGACDRFTTYGEYTIAVYAMDTDGNISLPKETMVSQQVGPDVYENDDSPSRAADIVLNDTKAQQHVFHENGDPDWVRFYAIAGQTYTIKAYDLGENCDIVLALFDTDGTTLLESVDTMGEPRSDEILDWVCPRNGIYYANITHWDPSISGEGADYLFTVYQPYAPAEAIFSGTVNNQNTGSPIADAIMVTNGNYSAINGSNGGFRMPHKAGTYELTVIAPGYTEYRSTFVVPDSGEVSQAILLSSLRKGDIDGDGDVDLADAILALKALAGSNSGGFHLDGDVGGDGRIGSGEVIYILQHASGLRVI